jgi:hypothetical protein
MLPPAAHLLPPAASCCLLLPPAASSVHPGGGADGNGTWFLPGECWCLPDSSSCRQASIWLAPIKGLDKGLKALQECSPCSPPQPQRCHQAAPRLTQLRCIRQRSRPRCRTISCLRHASHPGGVSHKPEACDVCAACSLPCSVLTALNRPTVH